MIVPASLHALRQHARILLLQGPMGPFFATLSDFLHGQGHQVWKINFNGGDQLFHRGRGAIPYRGDAAAWPSWLGDVLGKHRIQAIVLFGQSREMHRRAVAVARERGIAVFVFEEGYVRPDYVTLEEGGVNGFSALPRDPQFYRDAPLNDLPEPVSTQQRFRCVTRIAMQYLVATAILARHYPHHEYHRPIALLPQAFCWVRGGIRKAWYRWTERDALARHCSPQRSKQWFLLPLQVHNDSQIREHSRYRTMEAVIEEVVASFARHAEPQHELVIKHHPMDRAYRDFGRFIAQKAKAHGVSKRVFYVHDVHLPTLLKHACGVVTVNSTTGLQALYHHTPVFTLGDCLYALPGLVKGGALADFWREPGRVDQSLYQRFRNQLIARTQLNASFYAKAPGLEPTRSRALPNRKRAADRVEPVGTSRFENSRISFENSLM